MSPPLSVGHRRACPWADSRRMRIRDRRQHDAEGHPVSRTGGQFQPTVEGGDRELDDGGAESRPSAADAGAGPPGAVEAFEEPLGLFLGRGSGCRP